MVMMWTWGRGLKLRKAEWGGNFKFWLTCASKIIKSDLWNYYRRLQTFQESRDFSGS